jgi:arylsulfatase A-like enzyme
VLLSDHGEAFGEHDPARFFDAHCDTQYEELVHVPLLIRHPGLAGRPRVVERPVGLVDVAPTILDLLGIASPRRWQGRSLASLLVRDREDLPWVVSSATCSGPAIKAWREDRYKYIATFAVGADEERSFIPGKMLREELYDLQQDPAERFDIAGSESELLHLKRALLLRHYDLLKAWERAGESARAQPTSKLEKELRALGYL